jgi:hypothetical protein
MSGFEQSSFEGREGQTFTAQLDAETACDLELLTVTGRDNPGVRAFSLEFRGPLDRFVPQRTYVFTHADLGEFPMFIVPIAQREDGFLYEAVFSRVA